MIKICFASIFIGTFALMLTLIIFNGFEKVIREKMRGITSEAIINVPGKRLDDKSIKTVIAQEFSDKVKATSSSTIKQLIIDHNKQQSVIFIKGVEPATEKLVSNIHKKVVLPINNNLEKLLVNNNIIIGYKTAQNYNLSIGSEITILVPEPYGKRKLSLKKKKAKVSGIFKVGLDEYDSNFAYCSLGFIKSLYKDEQGVDQIALAFNNNNSQSIFSFENKKTKETIKLLQERLDGLSVKSWEDLYPALVSSLKLEKYVMFFILALITLVACMNMISLLFMQIQNKLRDIAIFKSMNMNNKTIRRIFLTIGLSITTFGSILGLFLAGIAGLLIEKYPFIKLPDVYFVSHLPARIDINIFLVVFLCTMLLGTLATWGPAKRAAKINIVDVLRRE